MYLLENSGAAVEWLPNCETYLNSFIFHVTVTWVKMTFKTSGNSQSVFKENLTGAKHVHASWSKLVCLRKWSKRLSQSSRQEIQTITIAKLILMINRKVLLKLRNCTYWARVKHNVTCYINSFDYCLVLKISEDCHTYMCYLGCLSAIIVLQILTEKSGSLSLSLLH